MTLARKRVRQEEFDDDPLDFKIPGSDLCLTQNRIPWDFTITTDSYISLCSRVYAALANENKKLAGEVPESAFQCFAIVYLWKRFAELLPSSKTTGSLFFHHLSRLHDDECWLPSPLQTYLNGIGNFRDSHYYDRQFVLPVFPKSEEIGGIPYTFGRVDANTHHFYEAYPAPGIAVLRMMADIKYTKKACDENFIWDLPKGLCPCETELPTNGSQSNTEGSSKLNKPTKNLLGWAPANRLTSGQLKFVKSIMTNDGSTFPTYGVLTQDFFQRLFSKMSEYLPANQLTLGLIVEGAVIPCPARSTLGSPAQGMTVKRNPESFKFDRSAMYCEGQIAVFSPYKLSDELVKGAAVAAFRMPKEPIDNRHCWAAYDFNQYTSVPESWIETRNTMYKYGQVEGLNEVIYSSGPTNKRVLQNLAILHSIIEFKKCWNIYA